MRAALFFAVLLTFGLAFAPTLGHATPSSCYNSTYSKWFAFNITAGGGGNLTYRIALNKSFVNFADFTANATEIVVVNSSTAGTAAGDVVVPAYVQTWDGTNGFLYITPQLGVNSTAFLLCYGNTSAAQNPSTSISAAALIYGNNFESGTNNQDFTDFTMGGANWRANYTTFTSAGIGSVSIRLNNTASTTISAKKNFAMPANIIEDFNVRIKKQGDNQDFMDVLKGAGQRVTNTFNHCCGSGISFQNASGFVPVVATSYGSWYHMFINVNTSDGNGYWRINQAANPKALDGKARTWGDNFNVGAGAGFYISTGGATGTDSGKGQEMFLDNIFVSIGPANAYDVAFGPSGNITAAPANTCTPTTGLTWNLNLADNCTITGLSWSGPRWNISSTGRGRVIISLSNLTYSNLTAGSFIEFASIVWNQTVRRIMG